MNTIKIRFYKTIQEEGVGERNEQIVINTSFLSNSKKFAASASNQIKKGAGRK